MGNATSDYGHGKLSEMRPLDLRFTHDSISTQFQDGHSLDETLEQVLNGEIDISRIPPLVVMERYGVWYVVRGNRRLYIYKLLQKHGKIQTVQVLMKNFDPVVFNRQNTSSNDGKSVRLRGRSDMEQRLNQIISQHTGWCVIL